MLFACARMLRSLLYSARATILTLSPPCRRAGMEPWKLSCLPDAIEGVPCPESSWSSESLVYCQSCCCGRHARPWRADACRLAAHACRMVASTGARGRGILDDGLLCCHVIALDFVSCICNTIQHIRTMQCCPSKRDSTAHPLIHMGLTCPEAHGTSLISGQRDNDGRHGAGGKATSRDVLVVCMPSELCLLRLVLKQEVYCADTLAHRLHLSPGGLRQAELPPHRVHKAIHNGHSSKDSVNCNHPMNPNRLYLRETRTGTGAGEWESLVQKGAQHTS